MDRNIQVLAAECLKAPRVAAERAVAAVPMMMRSLIPIYVLTAVAMAWVSIRLFLVPLRQLMLGFKA